MPAKPNWYCTASEIEALPPWHPQRDLLRLHEIVAYLRKLYNLPVSRDRVAQWVNRGVDLGGRRIYLKTTPFGPARMVRKVDLLAFLRAWP